MSTWALICSAEALQWRLSGTTLGKSRKCYEKKDHENSKITGNIS